VYGGKGEVGRIPLRKIDVIISETECCQGKNSARQWGGEKKVGKKYNLG